ncbi:unnamed protein product [Linum trigynum]|uniref:Uncharacterized protein n=1 Tax=Linum trigynum TaxID=586398 RepID=A0AAV2E3S3_9ROSI
MRTDLHRSNLTGLNTFPNIIAVHLDMLGALMKHRISSNMESNLIVTMKRSRATRMDTKFLQKPAQPKHLTNRACHGTILGLDGRACHHLLLRSLSRDGYTTESNNIAGGGPPSGLTTTPIGITISNKIKRTHSMKKQSLTGSNLEISENPVTDVHMSLCGSLNKLTENMNNIRDVRPSNGQIEKTTNQPAICCRIRMICGGRLSMMVVLLNWECTQTTIHDPRIMENIQCILS